MLNSTPARMSFDQFAGCHHFAINTSAAATSNSGVSGRTSVPNPTTIPARNHGLSEWFQKALAESGMLLGLGEIGFKQNEQGKRREKRNQNFG